jgi:hypothetical protein
MFTAGGRFGNDRPNGQGCQKKTVVGGLAAMAFSVT